jgi:CDP-paratose 2-epimerase
MLLAQANSDRLSGEAFNIGGGPANTTSLVELLDLMGELRGERPLANVEAWRPADQRYYVSDTRKFQRATGWRAKTSVREGVGRLHDWLLEQRRAVRGVAAGQVAS